MTGSAKRKVKPMSRKVLLLILGVIEDIVADDDCVMWEMESASKRFRGDKKKMFDKLSAIYRFSHSAIDTHSCYEAHEDWRREALEPRQPGAGKGARG